MNAYADQRVFERCRCSATIEFSHFNKGHGYEAQTLNNCDQGMCFKSEVMLQPGVIVCIRVKDLQSNDAWNFNCQGLRSVSLAEVKWCKEITNETGSFYEIGTKYFQPEC